MTHYKIPYHGMNENPNRTTIQNAIKLLSDDYLLNFAFINDDKRIIILETIVNLTDIYFNMTKED